MRAVSYRPRRDGVVPQIPGARRKRSGWLTLGVIAASCCIVAAACGSSTKSSGASTTAVRGRRSAGGVNPATMPESTTAFVIGNGVWGSTISYNPYNPNVVQFDSFALLPLAQLFDLPRPGKNPYYPELASSWQLGKSSITLHLRRSAKWQDGTPLTSSDVRTSLLLAGAAYNSIWATIRSISTPTPHELVLHLQSWSIPQTVFTELIQIDILSNEQYATFIPPGFQNDLVTYWRLYDLLNPTSATLQAASNSPAGKMIASVDAKLIKFNPPKLVGDGPYELVNASANGVLYRKWMGWWDAKSISVPWVEITPMSSATEYGAILSGRISQEENSQFTDPQAAKLNASGVGHYGFHPTPVQQESLVFHLADYPFNLLAVRKALAYLINRPKLAKLDMSGKVMQDPAATHPDGINHEEAKLYITAKQENQLHAYKYDPAKAAALLRGAGFAQRSGVWYTPKGKPFKFTIYELGGYTQLDEDGIIIAQMLKHFGIEASTQDTSSATYGAQELDGDYPVSENFMDWGVGSPMADFAATFVSTATTLTWNYPLYYNSAGQCKGCQIAIGIGPIADVPGLGKVNIGAALNKEVNTAPPSTWAKYTWDWARWINDELPILPLYNNAFHMIWSTGRYTDFPSLQKEAWMWTPLNGSEQTVWMQEGYLHLKH